MGALGGCQRINHTPSMVLVVSFWEQKIQSGILAIPAS